MSACKQQTFTGITQSRWDCIKKVVQNKTGIVITTDSGTATQSGFSVHWNFDVTTQALSIQVTDKPFIIPCSSIESQITGVVNGCP
jgi:hypothetical protein